LKWNRLVEAYISIDDDSDDHDDSDRFSTIPVNDLWDTWKSLYISLCKLGFVID
jgi:hypothetical protein